MDRSTLGTLFRARFTSIVFNQSLAGKAPPPKKGMCLGREERPHLFASQMKSEKVASHGDLFLASNLRCTFIRK